MGSRALRENVCVDKMGSRALREKVCVDKMGSGAVQHNNNNNHNRPRQSRFRAILVFRGVVVGVAKANNIMRLATEIEFAKGFACAAPAMYRNLNGITMYNVMSMCSSCNVSQLQCNTNYNVSVWSAYHLLQYQ